MLDTLLLAPMPTFWGELTFHTTRVWDTLAHHGLVFPILAILLALYVLLAIRERR